MPSEKNFERNKSNVRDTFEAIPQENSHQIAKNFKPSSEGYESNNDTDPEFECNTQFSPVVSLGLVETCTGQENENSLLDMKCKLYRFDSSTNEWKERGLGRVNLLFHVERNVVRLVMRDEKTLKIRANHIICARDVTQPETTLKKKDDNCWIWWAVDFAEDRQTEEKFCIRLGSNEKAVEFKKVFDYSCEVNSGRLKIDDMLAKLNIKC